MNRYRKRTLRIMAVAIAVFILIIIAIVIVIILKRLNEIKEIVLIPDFTETELKVESEYAFTVKTKPEKVKADSLEYNVDDASATIVYDTDLNKVVLHTGGKGSLTIYAKKGKVKSDKLSYTVIDKPVMVLNETENNTENNIENNTEDNSVSEDINEEVELEKITIARVIGDNVRMRSEPNTDSEIVKNCSKGETYNVIEVTGDWTGVDNNGTECYIKSEFVEEEVKEQEKPKADEPAPEESNNTEELSNNQEIQDTGKISVKCKDKTDLFTKEEYAYFIDIWEYTGVPEEMMEHHTAEELHTLYNNTH